MGEPGGEPDLALEALGAECGGELGAEDLDGDVAVVLEVVGEVDGGHAALAQLALEAVAGGEGVSQLVWYIGEWFGLSWRCRNMVRRTGAG